MANIARGKAECYISIEAECRVLYFPYSTGSSDLTLTYSYIASYVLADVNKVIVKQYMYVCVCVCRASFADHIKP